MNESAADWGLVFDTLLLIAFLQSDAETPEDAAEKFAKKLLDIPENVDLFAETPEERSSRSDKWYAQEWEKIHHWDDAGNLGRDLMGGTMRSDLELKIYKKIGKDGAANELQHAACEMNLAVGRLQLARRMEEAREVVGEVADAKRNLADKYAAVIAWAGVLGIELNPDACGGKLISWAKAIGIEVGDEGIKGPPGALGIDP